MSLPWSPQQIEWLQAMGLDVLRLNDAGDPGADAAPVPVIVAGVEQESIGAATAAIPRGLVRAARGVDLSPLLAALGPPRDLAARRAFWRALRPLRKAARTP